MEHVIMLSPDEKYKISFYDFCEPRMMMNICQFYLTDLRVNNVTKFDNLYTLYRGECHSWSENSELLLLPINRKDGQGDFFFLYDVIEKSFAIIKVRNVWTLEGNFESNQVNIRSNQIEEQIKTHTKYFRMTDVYWYPKEQLSEVYTLVDNLPIRINN